MHINPLVMFPYNISQPFVVLSPFSIQDMILLFFLKLVRLSDVQLAK